VAYKMRRYACPDCDGEFNYLHEVKDGVEEPPPNRCPHCDSWVGDSPPPLPSNFKTAGLAGKSGDAVYRAMEQSSEYRAQLAAKESGMDVKDFAALKMTNMKDNMREGDTSAIMPVTPVSQAMEQTRGVTGFNRGAMSGDNQKFIADAQTGPYRGAGNAARQNVVSMHQRTAAQTVASGQINKK
jgi:DNA-directed RNA polymerase subunit RPC12/RpoP